MKEYSHPKLNIRTIREIQGFTLIELLVVIIIIGVLGSIALPSYLNQAGRSRASEAKSTIGAALRSQESFYLQNGRMATQLSDLDVKVQGKFYTYAIQNFTQNYSEVLATSSGVMGDIKPYLGALQRVPGTTFFGGVICEGRTTTTTPVATILPSGPGEVGACNAESILIQ
jgi:type IV pilus assembly protein PilA